MGCAKLFFATRAFFCFSLPLPIKSMLASNGRALRRAAAAAAGLAGVASVSSSSLSPLSSSEEELW